MKRDYILFGIILLVIIVVGVNAVGASKSSKSIIDESEVSQVSKISYDKIEVYYFHRTQRCSTCLAIGRFTRELIEDKFADKVKDGKIYFAEINIDLPENKELVNRFKASGQSLYINVINNGVDNIDQDLNIWRLVGNESKFKEYLENKLNSLSNK
jgi:aryl-alcohol dehydrogenase-like predicted oxidoreductase